MKVTLQKLSEAIQDRGPDAVQGLLGSPNPALIMAPEFAPEEVDFGATLRIQPGPEETHSGERRSPWASLADGRSVVVPLKKSDRNPFAGVIAVGRREDNDVVLQAKGVSKLHALFQQSTAGWSLQDNNSKNGTYVNHKQLEGKELMPLKSGDEVAFAKVRAMFVVQAELVTLCSYVRSTEERDE